MVIRILYYRRRLKLVYGVMVWHVVSAIVNNSVIRFALITAA